MARTEPTPLNERKHQSLDWFAAHLLQVTWENGTVSWFRATPIELAENYKSKISQELLADATVAYAEYMLKTKTFADKLKMKGSFKRIEYEEMDE